MVGVSVPYGIILSETLQQPGIFQPESKRYSIVRRGGYKELAKSTTAATVFLPPTEPVDHFPEKQFRLLFNRPIRLYGNQITEVQGPVRIP